VFDINRIHLHTNRHGIISIHKKSSQYIDGGVAEVLVSPHSFYVNFLIEQITVERANTNVGSEYYY
jgi:hypothetical protein